METLLECPICKSLRFSYYLNCKDNTVSHETFQLVECNLCKLIFTNPRPSQQEIARYYQSNQYISHTNSSKGLFNIIYQKVRTIAIRSKVRMVRRLKSPNNRILDYGCGTGEFLNSMILEGWICQGVEPSEDARTMAINNYSLTISDPQQLSYFKQNEFGIITLWHVLEHIHDLKETVNQLTKSLTSGGYLIIAVPNSDAWDASYYQKYWAAYDVPRHLYHFNIKNIIQLMTTSELQLHFIKPMFFDPFYIALLSEKYKTGITNYFSVILNGIKTTIAGRRDISKNSSLIYIFKKT